jgi:hypothetical protein
VQIVCRAPKVALAGHRQKGPELPEADIHTHIASMNTIKRFDLSMGRR